MYHQYVVDRMGAVQANSLINGLKNIYGFVDTLAQAVKEFIETATQ